MKVAVRLFAAAALASGCSFPPAVRSPERVTMEVATPSPPPPSAAPEVAEPPAVLDGREERLLTAIRVSFPHGRRVRVVAGDAAPIRSALRAARLDVVESEPDVEVFVARDRSEARSFIAPYSPAKVVVWSDDIGELGMTCDRVHIVTPSPPSTTSGSASFEHLVIRGTGSPEVETALAHAGLWPWIPGLQTIRIHPDGSRDVRLLGYVDTRGITPPEAHVMIPRGAYGDTVELETPRALVPTFARASRRVRAEMSGPTDSLSIDLHRPHTMLDAVSTCSRNWATGAAVTLRGRARFRGGAYQRALHVDVERIESEMFVTSWFALAPRHRSAFEAVTRAVVKRGALSLVDYAPLRAFHADVRRTYGASSELLEIDAVLRALERAFERGSASEARDALWIRCRPPLAELALEGVLDQLARRDHPVEAP